MSVDPDAYQRFRDLMEFVMTLLSGISDCLLCSRLFTGSHSRPSLSVVARCHFTQLSAVVPRWASSTACPLQRRPPLQPGRSPLQRQKLLIAMSAVSDATPGSSANHRAPNHHTTRCQIATPRRSRRAGFPSGGGPAPEAATTQLRGEKPPGRGGGVPGDLTLFPHSGQARAGIE